MMKKYWRVLSSLTLAAMMLAACGSTDTKEKEVVGGNVDTGYEEPSEETPELVLIEEDAIQVEMVAKENVDKVFVFILNNTTDKDIKLTFANLQEYDFVIKDHTGAKVYQFSDDRMFGEAFVEKTIAANDSIRMEIDLTDVIPTLDSGIYSLEVWSSARESDGFRTEIELAVSNDVSSSPTSELASLVGIVDSNSIEMKDSSGHVKVYQITEDVKAYLEIVPENEPVTINFYEENGQLIITSIIVD